MLLILNALLKIESSRQFEHTNFDTFVEHELLALLLRPYEGHLLRHVPAVLHHLFQKNYFSKKEICKYVFIIYLGVAVEVRDCLEHHSTVHTRHSLAFLIGHLLSNTHRHFGARLGSQGPRFMSSKAEEFFGGSGKSSRNA